MANFNFGIDCPNEESAEKLRGFIESLDFFQDELDADEERVSLISKQGLLEELKKYASENSMELSIEVWPEGMEWDYAGDSGDIELFNFN
jgi:hypothetical protein